MSGVRCQVSGAKSETTSLSLLLSKEAFCKKIFCPRTFVNGGKKTFKKEHNRGQTHIRAALQSLLSLID